MGMINQLLSKNDELTTREFSHHWLKMAKSTSIPAYNKANTNRNRMGMHKVILLPADVQCKARKLY